MRGGSGYGAVGLTGFLICVVQLVCMHACTRKNDVVLVLGHGLGPMQGVKERKRRKE
jgi:hypothetical protein